MQSKRKDLNLKMNQKTIKQPNKKRKKKLSKIQFICMIILCVCLIIFIGIFILKSLVYPIKHFDTIKEQASLNQIDPYLVLAIIKTESGFDANATSNKNAKGLMQMLDTTANDIKNIDEFEDEIDTSNIYDVDVNIKLGCKYFSYLVKRYDGNYYLAICAYNAGLGNVDKWLEEGILQKDLSSHKNVDIPFGQTKRYLDKVISSYQMYRLLY